MTDLTGHWRFGLGGFVILDDLCNNNFIFTFEVVQSRLILYTGIGKNRAFQWREEFGDSIMKGC
jgi:hypothetical protein